MKRILSAAALAIAALSVSAPASSAIVISFDPASSHVAIGADVVVTMKISGLDAEILSAFDIDLLFDEAIVDNIVIGFFGQNFGFPDDYFQASFLNGRSDVIGGSLLDDATLAGLQANDFDVLQFTFRGVADGATTLSLGPNPDFERNFVGLGFQSLDVQIGTACISVGTGSCNGGPVPEPATYGLAALGLLGAGMIGRRRRRETASA